MDCANVDYKNLFLEFPDLLGFQGLPFVLGSRDTQGTTIEQKQEQKVVFGNLLCCQKTCFKLMNLKSKSILSTKKDFPCDINI